MRSPLKLPRLFRPGQESPKPQLPIPFVVGVPRSGTTLLRMMLDEHPDLAIPAETHFMPELLRKWREWRDDGVSEDERCQRVIGFLDGFHRRQDWPVTDDEIAAALKHRPITPGEAISAVHVAYARKVGKPRWGDKTPQYLRRMQLLQRAIPNARFIHLIRDGRDVGVSVTGLSWGADTTEEAAEQWVRQITQARERAATLQPDTYLEVRYEDLVSDPEPTLSRIAEFIELPWDPVMLEYHRSAERRVKEWDHDLERQQGGVITAEERIRQHRFTTKPPTTERIGRWKKTMPAEDQQRFEEIAGSLLDELGYERRFPELGKGNGA